MAPRAEFAWILLVDVVTAAVVLQVLASARTDQRDVGVLLLLLGTAVGFEEIARRAARLKLRLGKELKLDTGSVWAVAGAVALSPVSSVVLLGTVRAYIWIRQQRPAGEKLYRKWFDSSTEILGMILAGRAAHDVADLGPTGLVGGLLPSGIDGALAVALAVLVYTLVNRVLVTVAIVTLGVRGRTLLGSVDQNLIELATLCLGGLVSLAAIYQPWLVLLVVAPMYALQRGALVRELETAAMTDSKTGLLNAVAWEQLVQREIARARRTNSGLAVLIIDIDRFKSVNDRFGHLVGDRILHQIARTMSGALRDYDTLGRFGGEEFVAVLPDVDELTALAIAERVREQVARLRVSSVVDSMAPVADDGLAVSIGVSLMPADGLEVSDLLHCADRALYLAKASGRNRVELATRGDEGTPVVLPFA